MHPYSGALLHVLRNREYRVHHHPANAPFHPDNLPEARLPAQITHPGGGCWLAYKKHVSWTLLLSPMTLPQNCPRATTCAVELTLLDGSKAAIISCYLAQTTEAHADTCETLSKLPRTLPHSLIVFLGGIYREAGTDHPQRMSTSLPCHITDGGDLCSPPSHRTNGRYNGRVLTTLPSGTLNVFRSRRKTRKRSRQPSSIITRSWAHYNCPFLSRRSCPS
jgi:hypothetical protein